MKDSQQAIDPIRPLAGGTAVDPLKEYLRVSHEVMRAVQFLNRSEMETLQHGYKYSFSQDTAARRPVIRLVDEATGNTLYQIPPEEVLRRAVELRRKLAQQSDRGHIRDGFDED